MNFTNFLALALVAFMAVGCASADLRPDNMAATTKQYPADYGRELLRASSLAMGYDKLAQAEVYEARTDFNWKPFWALMPMNAFPGSNGNAVQLRYATNSFDGQLEYLEGPKKGKIRGLQSWQGYKGADAGAKKVENGKARYAWGLATFHYLVESPLHLPDAEIVRYAGKREFDGITYDLVYATWGEEAPNKDYDRFLLYINPETKFVDLMEATIGDYFLPMPKGMQHATVRYEREPTSIGAYLPAKLTIQLLNPKENDKKYVYYWTMEDYQFDATAREKLYPMPNVPYTGMAKPSEQKKARNE